MRTIDTHWIGASPERVFRHAAEVERWPAILSHYRWVKVLSHRPAGAPGAGSRVAHELGPADRIVEMAAWRPFGLLRWPTWWVSEMWVRPDHREVHYRHIDGITRGMNVQWSVVPERGGARAIIVHEWEGPAWPLIRRPAAAWVIGPVFVRGIASRTLAGIARAAEREETDA
ncbi:MAG: SRPBCC family protein [Gemmatimonadales bacterium]